MSDVVTQVTGGLVTVRGSKVLTKRLSRLSSEVGPAVELAVDEASVPIAQAAASAAPVRFGYLKRSMGHVVRKGRFRNSRYSVIGAKGSGPIRRGNRSYDPRFYSHLAEKGTAAHSLATAVNMKLIRRGLGPWTTMAGMEGIPAVSVRYRHRARELARNYLLRRDRGNSLRTHPGARPHPFLAPALAAHGDQLVTRLRTRIGAIIQAATVAA